MVFEDHWHSVVNQMGIWTSLGGDDGRRVQGFLGWQTFDRFVIGGPEGSQGQGFRFGPMNPIRLFVCGLFFGSRLRTECLFPFVVAIGDQDAATLSQQRLVGWFFFKGFASSVDHAVSDFEGIGPGWNQAPTHRVQYWRGIGSKLRDHQYVLSWCDVVPGLEDLWMDLDHRTEVCGPQVCVGWEKFQQPIQNRGMQCQSSAHERLFRGDFDHRFVGSIIGKEPACVELHA